MSNLYKIPLQGEGTKNVESLLSYVLRVGAEHGVNREALLGHLIAWYPPLTGEFVPTNRGLINKSIHTLTRPSETTKFVVNSLAWATGQQGLRSSTFLALEDAFGRATMVYARYIQYCVICLREMEQEGVPSYLKLSWCLMDITYCDKHLVHLSTGCKNCGGYSHTPYFEDGVIICRRCTSPLSSGPVNPLKNDERRSASDLYNLVKEIALNPSLSFPCDGVIRVADAIREDNDLTQDARRTLRLICQQNARVVKLNRSTAQTMKDARRVAMLAGISVADALAGNIKGTTKDLGWFNEDDVQADEPSYSRDQRDRETIKLELSKYLISNRDGAPSLQQIADKLQVSKGYLYYNFEELSALIVGNHAAWLAITKKDQERLARWYATLHFLDPKIEDDLKIRKRALVHLQSTTKLPKQKLSEEINHVYEVLCDYL